MSIPEIHRTKDVRLQNALHSIRTDSPRAQTEEICGQNDHDSVTTTPLRLSVPVIGYAALAALSPTQLN